MFTVVANDLSVYVTLNKQLKKLLVKNLFNDFYSVTITILQFHSTYQYNTELLEYSYRITMLQYYDY